MAIDIKKRAVTPFIISLGFIVVAINGLSKGIEQHQPWRIAAAATGGLIFLSMAILLVFAVYKNSKTSPKA